VDLDNTKKMTQLKEQPCPTCTRSLNAASAVEGNHLPKVGDVTICLYCGSILMFYEGLDLKAMTSRQIDDLPVEVMIQLAKLSGVIKKAQA